jgi:hypothetical protein
MQVPETKTTEDTKAAPPAPPSGPEKTNLGVITKLTHTILDTATTSTDFASLKEDIKTQCRLKAIAYDAEVVGQALESALAARGRS